MNEENQSYLVVGLGNPGSAYDATRHNMGFRTVRHFAEKMGFSFHHGSYFQGEVAQGRLERKKTILLLPQTYMNSSGQSVKLCADYFKMNVSHILIVCDDIALPFGTLRIRAEGSAGGHNGLKSVEEHLNTKSYPRLKIGIGDRNVGGLSDFVLGRFTEEEKVELPKIEEKAAAAIACWIAAGVEAAAKFISAKEPNKAPDDRKKLGD